MNTEGFLFQAFIYLAASVVAVPIAKRLGLGSVLGYLIAGILIGPFVFGFVGAEGQDVLHFAEFGVVLMLFIIGLELRPSLLWKLRVPILGMGGTQVALTTVLFSGIAVLIGLPWQSALAIGLTLSLSSTAIVLQSLSEKGFMKTAGGQSSLSILLFQDIAVIPILAVFPLLAVQSGIQQVHAGDHAETLISSLPLWAQTAATVGVVAVIIVGGRYIASPAFRLIARTGLRELFTAASLLLVVGIALLMSAVGLSPALGTFLAGVVLAGSEYRHELETDIEPFKGLLLGLFFVAVGASVDLRIIGSDPLLVLGLVGLLVVGKILVLLVVGRLFKLGTDNTLLASLGLAQGGEFAFVLLAFAVQNSVVGEDVAAVLVAAVAVSMALTPLLLLLYDKVIRPRVGTKEQAQRQPDTIDQSRRVIVAGFGRVGSTVGRFLQANGVNATYLDVDPDNVDLLRKLGMEVFYGDACRQDLLKAAGAAEAKLLVVAVDDAEKAQQIVETSQKHFPNMEIMVRSVSWGDTYDHLEQGIDRVYRETFETALRMGADALNLLGFRRYFARRAANRFRRHEEGFVRELAALRNDDKQLVTHARSRLQDLEQIMRQESEDFGASQDVGWDASALIAEYGDGPEGE